jgi:hypothetical protein
MPLKLNLGLSKKVGLPHYSSLGASCHVEVELDSALLRDDLDGFHAEVRAAYIACSQAVHDELARQRQGRRQGEGEGPSTGAATAAAPDPAPASPAASSLENPQSRQNGNPVSERQRAYIRQLVDQLQDRGLPPLDALTDSRFGKSLAELSTAEASLLIDRLKAIKAGAGQPDPAWTGTGR